MPYLGIVFSNPMHLASVGSVDDEVVVDGVHFKDDGFGNHVGFYDFLRDDARDVIGIRCWMKDHHLNVLKASLARHSAVGVEGDQVRVYFGSSRSFVDMLSADQDFGVFAPRRAGDVWMFIIEAPEEVLRAASEALGKSFRQ